MDIQTTHDILVEFQINAFNADSFKEKPLKHLLIIRNCLRIFQIRREYCALLRKLKLEIITFFNVKKELIGVLYSSKNWRVYFQNVLNPLLVLLRKTGFFDRIYTRVYGKTNFRFKKKMYLRELSRSKFHSVTSSNVILYNDAKNSIFIKSGFNTFWKWALQLFHFNYCHPCQVKFCSTFIAVNFVQIGKNELFTFLFSHLSLC